MLTHEIKQLDEAFKTLVKRRRGTLIQRAGAGARDFEMSFEFRGLEVLFGIESGWIADDAMFLFVRHGKSPLVREHVNPFMPPPPETDLSPIQPDLVAKALAKGGRAGTHLTATPSAPSGTAEDEGGEVTAPRIPGFSIRVRPMDLAEKLYRLLRRRSVFSDPRRPGWFHLDLEPGDRATALPEGLRAPMDALLAGGPPITRLSVAMTSLFFRIRRVPFPLDVSSIESFVTNALVLFHAALDKPPEVPRLEAGLELFALLENRSRSRCGVCGEEPTTRRVQCAKCDTPHHDECWKYGGGCSVYACGSTVHIESA
jgi:hypothetical protein